MTVTFCGHRHCPDSPEIRAWLVSCVEALIAEGADKFYFGGCGDFDRMAASVVWKLKDKYPPIESAPMRFAITARNHWLVDNSDVLVAYVILDSGGVADLRRYAISRKKRVLTYNSGVSK